MTLSREDVKLSQDVKRANQRLRQIEKDRTTAFSAAYEDALGLYEQQQLIPDIKIMGLTKKGEFKFRTDISKLSAQEKQSLEALVASFLDAPTSGAKGIKKRREKLSTMQENFMKKYGQQYSGAQGLERVKRIADDSQFFNKLREYFDSDEAEEVMEDIDKGRLDPESVDDYLNSLPDGQGALMSEVYEWSSTTEDWLTDWS